MTVAVPKNYFNISPLFVFKHLNPLVVSSTVYISYRYKSLNPHHLRCCDFSMLHVFRQYLRISTKVQENTTHVPCFTAPKVKELPGSSGGQIDPKCWYIDTTVGISNIINTYLMRSKLENISKLLISLVFACFCNSSSTSMCKLFDQCDSFNSGI